MFGADFFPASRGANRARTDGGHPPAASDALLAADGYAGVRTGAWHSPYAVAVRASEFRRAVATEFGEQYGRALLRDLVIDELGYRTADQALEAGVPEREVWLALCEAMEVPVARRHGAGLPEPRRR